MGKIELQIDIEELKIIICKKLYLFQQRLILVVDDPNSSLPLQKSFQSKSSFHQWTCIVL